MASVEGHRDGLPFNVVLRPQGIEAANVFAIHDVLISCLSSPRGIAWRPRSANSIAREHAFLVAFDAC